MPESARKWDDHSVLSMQPAVEPKQTSVELLSGEDAVERAASAWGALEERGGAPSPFQTYVMARVAARVHTARGEQIHVAIVREGERPMAIVAVTVGRWLGVSTLRFLGDPFIQYGDALAAPDATPDHIARAWRALAERHVASFAWLRKVRADALLAPLLKQAGTVIGSDAAPFIDLANPASNRGARKLRRWRERLAAIGPVTFDVSEGEAAKPWLDRALMLKRDWMAARGLTSRVIGDPFWEGAFGALAQQNDTMRFAAAHLSCGDRPAAIEIGFIFRNRWYAYLGALEMEFAKFSPGQIQIADTVAYCRNAGLEVYDFLGPAYPHKTAWMDGQIATHDFGVALDVRGFAGLYTAQMIPGVKAKIMAMPPGLRRFIFRGAGKDND